MDRAPPGTSQPCYFMPPTSTGVTRARPVRQNSQVIDNNVVNNLPPPAPDPLKGAALPWYDEKISAPLGIRQVAIGVTLQLEHGINQLSHTKISVTIRKD